MPRVKKLDPHQLTLDGMNGSGVGGTRPASTAQQLGSILKAARDIMRKDKGLNGDLDRLPMLTWVMFLKFLDDTEQLQREEEAEARRARSFKPALDVALPLARLGRRVRRALRATSSSPSSIKDECGAA